MGYFMKIEISSTTRSQLSFSEKYRENEEDPDTTHGVLTWNFLHYLKGGYLGDLGMIITDTSDTYLQSIHAQSYASLFLTSIANATPYGPMRTGLSRIKSQL